ncbi:MAG: hypothetical protein JJE51_10000 [Thermoanaerobaculia bacterium]|nr:hypothetical protein [Thermoanaerobaculia bacterium]
MPSFAINRSRFLLLCLIGITFRLVLTATSYGTNDANFWSGWASMVREVGVIRTYSITHMINHPPAALAAAGAIAAAARALDLAFIDLFRLVQIAADVVAAIALYSIGKSESVDRGRALALFVLLSPAAAFVSAFHCNSDSAMIALTVLAARFAMPDRRAAAIAGLILACAVSVKIVPFLFVPLFLVAVGRQWPFFLGAFSVSAIASFLPAVVRGGPLLVRRIFGYGGGLPNEWGVTGWAVFLGNRITALRDPALNLYIWYRTFGRFVVYMGLIIATASLIRRGVTDRRRLLFGVAIIVMVLLTLAPGFGVQYIAWIIPLLPFAFRWRIALSLNAIASLFLFITYSAWQGGWPWWYASVANQNPYRYLGTVAGLVMWVVVAAALAYAVRSFRSEPTQERAG